MKIRRDRLSWCGAVLCLLAGAGWAGAEDEIDRAKNLEFDASTGQWVEVEPPVAGTPEGDLRIARALQAEERHDKAEKAVKAWMKEYGEGHELYPQAVLLQCEVMIAERDYYKAHKRLQEFLNAYAASEYEDRALQMEFVIAEVFLSGTKRKFLGIRFLKADDIGLSILDDITANYPGSRLAELAILTKANYYFKSGDFAFAEQEYNQLIQKYPRSRYVRRSMLQSAHAALASFPGTEFDDAPLIEAEERFRRYLAQYPGSAEQEGVGVLLDQISEQRAEKEFQIGRYYERAGHPQAAQFYYRSTVTHWPETLAAIKAAKEIRSEGEVVEPPAEPVQQPPEVMPETREDNQIW